MIIACRWPVRASCLFLLAAALHGRASAQSVHDRTRVWLGAGLAGGGGTKTIGGLGLSGQLVYQKHPHQVTMRALELIDLRSGGTDALLVEGGLLYGRTRTRPWGHVSASAGGGLVWFEDCPDGPEACATVGVPLTAEAAVNSRVLGIGLQAFGNINPKAFYRGFALFVQLGWLP
jgi:hypothetical protein